MVFNPLTILTLEFMFKRLNVFDLLNPTLTAITDINFMVINHLNNIKTITNPSIQVTSSKF